MDKDKIKGWLTTESKDRQWLADQLGCSKGTVDQWFSRGFPDWALKSIERLMNPAGSNTGGIEVAFTASEFERIEEARKLLGLATRKDYYQTAITEFTDRILENEAQGTQPEEQHTARRTAPDPAIRESSIEAGCKILKLYSSADDIAQSKVAEDPLNQTIHDLTRQIETAGQGSTTTQESRAS